MMEKTPSQSKKWTAFLVAELTWTVLIAYALFLAIETAQSGHAVPSWLLIVILAMVVTDGFVEIGYIGGQAWLDKYVRVAQITAEAAGGKAEPGPT